jgi:DUF4097 and DUF4098 domain-containing protein YvlB
MHKLLIFLVVTLSGLTLEAQSSYEREPFLTKSFPNSPIQQVKSETQGGNITVTAVAASQARVEMFVWPNGRSENRMISKTDLQKKLDELYSIDISFSGGKLTAVAKAKDHFMNGNNALNISFKVFVPQQVSTDLHTSGGNISLDGVSGEQVFSTSGGNLDIDHVSGSMQGKTSGGNVDVKNCSDVIDLTTSGGNVEAERCMGKINLRTSGGNLSLRSLKGTIRASTSGGSVWAQQVGGELVAHTSGGDITMNDLTCSLETSTSGGNIDVSITTLGAYVTIDNSGGDVHLSLPAGKGLSLRLHADRVTANQLSNFSGTSDEHKIEGTLNGGGIPVHVDGGSGNITLTLK